LGAFVNLDCLRIQLIGESSLALRESKES